MNSDMYINQRVKDKKYTNKFSRLKENKNKIIKYTK